MLINYFIKDKIEFREIENYSNIGLLIFSIAVVANDVFNYDYNFCTHSLTLYAFCDLLFTPFNKLDMIFHHILCLSFWYYVFFYEVDLYTNYFSTKMMFRTEISSIFLSLSSLINNTNIIPHSFGIKNIVNAIIYSLFIITFFKYRIYDFYNYVINFPLFYDCLALDNSKNLQICDSINCNLYLCQNNTLNGVNIIQTIYHYTVTSLLFVLNLYWLTIMVKILFKRLRGLFTFITAEYYLQYSYFICLFTTIATYTIYASEFQKLYYNTFIIIDVTINLLLSITSYNFHNYLYKNLSKKYNFNLINYEYFKFLFLDLIAIQLRAVSQLYVHLNMHNMFDKYYYLFHISYTISIFILPYIAYVFYNVYNTTLTITYEDMYSRELKVPLLKQLDSLYGLNPFLCILLSTIGVFYSHYATQSYLISIILAYIVFMRPFYELNHLFVHIGMSIVNYCLVLNNVSENIKEK